MIRNSNLRDTESEKFTLILIVAVAGCATVFVTPFAVYRFVVGDYLVAITDAALIIIAICCALVAYIKHSVRIPGVVTTVVVLVATVLVTTNIGVNGALWLFPIMMFAYYLVSHILAGALVFTTLIAIAALEILNPGAVFSSYPQMAAYFAAAATSVVFSTLFSRQHSVQSNRLMRWATIDPLTGLGNRRSLEHEMRVAVATAVRHGVSQGLMIVDLDKFKSLNDRFGHVTGDRVLEDFAALLRTSTRLEDRIFRYGGDEFVVILPNTDRAGLTAVTEHLLAEIRTHFRERPYPITASIGAGILLPGETLEQWRERVDRCMYKGKSTGGDTSVICESEPAA